MKNSTAFPVRNSLKRVFLVPHLEYFYQVLLSIAETYAKGIKDSDSQMFEFLKESTLLLNPHAAWRSVRPRALAPGRLLQ